jgi:hypothetical protein
LRIVDLAEVLDERQAHQGTNSLFEIIAIRLVDLGAILIRLGPLGNPNSAISRRLFRRDAPESAR